MSVLSELFKAPKRLAALMILLPTVEAQYRQLQEDVNKLSDSMECKLVKSDVKNLVDSLKQVRFALTGRI
jgi:hypothetical protein